MEKRVVLKLDYRLAPIKVAIFPLSKKPELAEISDKVHKMLKKDHFVEYDDRGSIGKRYRRQDEIGTPLCVTIDFESLNDNAVTIRDRDTMKQERVKIEELSGKIHQIINS